MIMINSGREWDWMDKKTKMSKVIEPPKTLEDFEKVLESIIELQNNPWVVGTMSDSLLEKEYQVRKKIKELKTKKMSKEEYNFNVGLGFGIVIGIILTSVIVTLLT